MNKAVRFGILISILIGPAACQTRDEIQIKDAWGRALPAAIPNGAFYMTLRNRDDEADRLLAVETSACAKVELHETYLTVEGVMGMRPVVGGVIEIPAKGEVKLEPGSIHLMCINKTEDFTAGKKFMLTLKFEKASEQKVIAEIKESEGMSH